MFKSLLKTFTFVYLLLTCTINNNLRAQYITKFDNFSFAKDARVIYQDSRGFLWIGTDKKGLFRYDGNINSLHAYYKNTDDKRSISDNNIWSIVEDKDSSCLWIATDFGLNRYIYGSDDFEVFVKDTLDSNSISDNEVMSLAKDKNGNVWVGVSNHGLNKIINQNGHYIFKHYSNDVNQKKSFPLTDVWYITFDKNNYCWVGNIKQGLCVFNASLPDDKIVYRQCHVASAPLIESNNIQHLYFDEVINGVWLLNNDGMIDLIQYKSDPVNDSTLVFHLKDTLFKKINRLRPDYLKGIMKDTKGVYWLAHAGGGITCFNLSLNNNRPEINIQNQFNHSLSSIDGIASDNINCFYQDHSDNIWIGTDVGVSRHRNSRYLFQQGLESNIYKQFIGKDISQIKTDPFSNIWIGRSDINTVYFLRNKKHSSFDLKNKEYPKSNVSLTLHDFLFCSNGDLMIACMPGLYVIKKNEVENFILNGNQPAQISIFNHDEKSHSKISESILTFFSALIETKTQKIFVGTMDGLFVLDSNFKANKIATDEDNVASDRIRDLIEITGNRLLIGTDNGLYCFDVNKMQPVALATLFQNHDGKLGDYITSFAAIDKDQLLIGTYSGLYKLNIKKKLLTKIGPNDILVNKVLWDNKNRLIYFSSDNGIYRIDENGNIMNVNSFDGLFFDKANEGCGVLLPNGVIAFGGNSGLNSFYSDSLSPSIYTIPALTVTDFIVDGVSIFKNDSALRIIKEQFLSNQTIKLASNQNDISVSFSAMNFLSSEKNSFQYKLRGVDTNWIDNSHSTNFLLKLTPIRYSWFFPGTYHIKIRCKTPGGIWKTITKPLLVSIKPVWNKSIEFISLLALLFLTAVVYIVRYFAQQKLKEQIREQEKLLAIERERNRISEDLHDDLGAGLSSIAMMTGVMKDLVTDDESRETAEDVSTEANELVGRMREIIWSMNSKNDTLENLITYLDEYSNKYLSKNKINCEFNVEGTIPQKNIRADKRENIFLVFKETLHNIVKYAASPTVNIDITIDENKLTLEVFDNGKGFDMNNISRFGNGLSNMKQRIVKVEGTFSITSAIGNGTRTKLNVPLN